MPRDTRERPPSRVSVRLLQEVWSRQLEFNARFLRDKGVDLGALSAADRAAWTRQFVLHIENELHELLRTTSWKMHRRADDSPVVRSNVREEWVDAFKFLLGLAQVWGFEPGELLEEFHRKSTVVEFRYRMEAKLAAIAPTDPVVAVDIDGVLNDYPRSFLRWVEKRPGMLGVRPGLRTSGWATLRELRDDVGPRKFLELKDSYRESGAKRDQGVRPGAKELLDGLRSNGLPVVLLSKRPYWRFYRIYADTLEWLERNGLFADAVLFHPEKHRQILESFPKLLAMIEDDPRVAEEVRAAGYDVVLVRSELNEGIDGENVVERPDEALARIAVPADRRWR
jgi:phosphoglycolate phosphatase-like HAD superfamily hydrolase